MKGHIRVLVDARWVALAPESSHARYMRALAAEWAYLPDPPALTLVGPGPSPVDLATNPNVQWHRTPNLPGPTWRRPGGRLWLNTIFTPISLAMRPDVMFFPWSVLPRVLVAPAVVTVHDVCFRTNPDRFADGGRGGDAVLDAAVRSATEVLTPSAESKRGVVAAYGLSERRVTIVRHGIAPIFNPVPSTGDRGTLRKLGVSPPYFLCVSTHEPRKNLDVLARAFVSFLDCCHPTDPQPQLVLVGRRSEQTPRIIECLSASCSAAERTHLINGVSDAELAALYRHASALALPTVCEGFGFPLLEAIACGTPAVVSDLAVFHELVGDAAVFVPSSDVGAWAAALRRAAVDAQLRARAVRAATRVRCDFAWRNAASETLRVLERAALAGRKLHWRPTA